MLSKVDGGLFIINKVLCVWSGRSIKSVLRGVSSVKNRLRVLFVLFIGGVCDVFGK